MTRILDYIFFLFDLVSGRRTGGEYQASVSRQQECEGYIDFNHPLMILDLANGALKPQSTILSNAGHTVVGIDFVNIPHFGMKKLLYAVAIFLFRLHLVPRGFFIRTNIRTKPLYLMGDVGALPFKAETFDLITSMAAFEHFLDVPSVVAECARVLKPGGVIWVSIHVFTTISGGHNVGMRLDAVSDLPRGVEPWDHLRKRHLPFTVPLNEFRVGDYLQEFEKHFSILKHGPSGNEGTDMLTAEVRSELSEYSEMELTCGAYRILAQKS
jgi:SAM-dependent methyltransferase